MMNFRHQLKTKKVINTYLHPICDNVKTKTSFVVDARLIFSKINLELHLNKGGIQLVLNYTISLNNLILICIILFILSIYGTFHQK